MGTWILKMLESKSLTGEIILDEVRQREDALAEVITGLSSPIPRVRYGCAKILRDLSEKYPEVLYPYMGIFLDLLNSKYRILKWNAIATIANLTRADKDGKFDSAFEKYYALLGDGYMVTVANVVSNSGKIASAKPYLIPRIVGELLKVGDLQTTPHITEECKRVIAEAAIKSFGTFYGLVDDRELRKMISSFVSRHVDSQRKTLASAAREFLAKYGC